MSSEFDRSEKPDEGYRHDADGGPHPEADHGHGRGGMGQEVKRKEDRRFITGRGNYVDDIKKDGMLHCEIVRSPYAHARINDIDTSGAEALDGVVAVLTAEDLAAHDLATMPTLMSDTQDVLVSDKVKFQSQEVAAVIAEDRYIAKDGAEKVRVDYETLDPVVDAKAAMEEDAPLVRDDIEGQESNHIFTWETGDEDATKAAFDDADVVVEQDMYYQRIHPAPIETCGCVADWDTANEKMTVHMTSQAPHAHRTLFSMVSGIPENKIRIVSPDVGGGFGNKVPIYPGYVVAAAASYVIGQPVKWVEERSENIQTTAFARDYDMTGRIAATEDGIIEGVDVDVLANHGAYNAAAQPSKFPAGFFKIFTGSYDIDAAHGKLEGIYTNTAPGGIAYRCSFRVTEAIYLIERMVDVLADELDMDPAEVRRKNFIPKDSFPYDSATGWTYDSGDYTRALDKALEGVGYEELLEEQQRRIDEDEEKLLGIGLSTFTEIVGAGPGKQCDIVGVEMFDSAEIRVHPTGKATVGIGVQTQGQGHETTFAQIVAEELGLDVDDVTIEHGDTDSEPYGLGTYASRSTPVGGAATAVAARKVREKAKSIAANELEVAEADVAWDRDSGSFHVEGAPDRSMSITEIAAASYMNSPANQEPGLEAVDYYDPPNMTYPFGAYVCVVEIDRETGHLDIQQFYALDDCGNRINPMVIEGQVHGGVAQGMGTALLEHVTYDENGNVTGGDFMNYLLPTAAEIPHIDTDYTVTPSPHHPIGAKGVGESPTVGSPPAIVNAAVDALSHAGVRHVDMPLTPDRVWEKLDEAGLSCEPADHVDVDTEEADAD
ncbi:MULTISPECIES: aerobic carbon-monoxide dehydrogenase large subunit [unclassified Haladaptatus]|uniref:aerobic carbon-monoxide dehydrogenase large subunit n=1 Tax=unclassified Haladaptatus TaxID=2622732 RepID=UPI00209C2575|nr:MULTISPECIES: aerobic carbon-monoxide dehydrogenase large subunit [unclassified Haladaptatus]MCO8243417.1 aerobic carbon-monoxide dehydrogenase large subunit [Haladaptatus sp. AB643]MCO8254824.1 aerobic carbon-monoxide dehydrogenase large subunit [Haladaptatus sp. AB618]